MFTVQFHVKSALSKPKSCHKGLSDNLQGHWFFFQLVQVTYITNTSGFLNRYSARFIWSPLVKLHPFRRACCYLFATYNVL